MQLEVFDASYCQVDYRTGHYCELLMALCLGLDRIRDVLEHRGHIVQAELGT